MNKRCFSDSVTLVVIFSYVINMLSSYEFILGDALLVGLIALPDMVVSG